MPFCRNCGAETQDINSDCDKCNIQAGQYYQPMPYIPPPMPSSDRDVGKVIGIVALVIVIIIIVTVVLAAVLYVMVIGMGDIDFVSTPVGSWNSVEATSSTTAKLTFGFFIEEVAPTDLQILIREEGSNIGYILWADDTSSTTVDMNWINGPAGVYAEYSDFIPAGDEINQGDFITLYGLEPDTSYSIEVIYLPTDSIMYMSGTSSFTTQP